MPLTFQEAVEDALSTVRLVARWNLAADEWPAVEAALAELRNAVESGRAADVRRAQNGLEDLGPRRLAAIARLPSGEPAPRNAPPVAVLELVNTLVHPSGGWSGSTRSSATTDG